MKNKVINISLLISSIIISLILCEIVLRIFSGNDYYIWLPHKKYVFLPNPVIMPGIKDTAYFEVNSLGFRGSDNPVNNAINIVILGGSATQCTYLDQYETWPALLEKLLNQSSIKKYNVFNGGRGGITSQHHLMQLQKLLKKNQWIDIIVVMEGLNDLQYALSFANNYQSLDSSSVYAKSFWVSPPYGVSPFYKDTYLFKYISKLKNLIFSGELAEDPFGNSYIKWRSKRANAIEIIDKQPNLEKSLADYQKNNQSMINFVKSNNKRIIFLSQPAAWDSVMAPSFSKLCWYGWIGQSQYENTRKYYSFTQLKRSLDRYNTSLKNICLNNKVGFIELEGKLEKDTTTFYDDCHFNESGAEKVAKIIYTYLEQNL